MEDEKKVGGSRPRVLRPRKKVSYEEHRTGEPQRNYESRPYGERPQRNFGERRSYGDRPQRSYGDRPSRPYGEHGDGEQRPYGEHRSYGDRPQRNFGERRSYGDRPQRGYGDRPSRPYGEHGDGEQRPYGERRSYGDRPQRNFGERRSYGDRPQRSYGDRPQRNFGDRPARNSGPRKPFAGKGGYHFDDREDSGINKMLSRKPQVSDAQYSDADSVPTEIQEEVRLNRYIANSGVCSRREADTYIQAGVVTVNGEVVTELGTKVNVLTDDIRFNGERLKGEEKVYIVMNKPKGYVTSVSDPHAEKTVMDLLKGCTSRVFPVGRLDKATTGVLMFTNDGEMAEKLTHPSYDKKKIYQVIVDHDLTQEDYDRILSGVTLSDGDVKADELEYIDEHDHRRLGIEIHSGKNRIVRRIFESLGYDVKALDRVYFAGLTKKGLQKGEWRYLTEGEVNILKMGAYV